MLYRYHAFGYNVSTVDENAWHCVMMRYKNVKCQWKMSKNNNKIFIRWHCMPSHTTLRYNHMPQQKPTSLCKAAHETKKKWKLNWRTNWSIVNAYIVIQIEWKSSEIPPNDNMTQCTRYIFIIVYLVGLQILFESKKKLHGAYHHYHDQSKQAQHIKTTQHRR